MEHYLSFKNRCVPCIVLAAALALAACSKDGDYDFDGIDMTVGFGGDGITLPVSSTDTVKLADVLELDGSECVVVKPNGDYVFEQKGDEVAPARPEIGKITISQQGEVQATGIPVTVASVGGKYEVKAGGEVLRFSYSGDKPAEVVSLDHVDAKAGLSLDVNFPGNLKNKGVSIDKLTLELPAFMEIEVTEANIGCAKSGAKLVFTNVSPEDGIHLRANVSGLDFNAADKSLGGISAGNGKIALDGRIRADVDVTIDNVDIAEGEQGYITASLALGDIELTGAKGRFNPSINLDDLGSVNVTGVPDFLTDGNVVVDLYNPQILLTIDNDMDVAGYVSGTITSTKNGVQTASVSIDDIPVKAAGTTNVCICRRGEGVDAALYDVIKPVDNLSDLIRTIPDRIDFSANAKADDKQTANFTFGHQYTVKPGYSVEAPITFDKDARIVYTDTIDGWNDDIKDLELADGSYVELSTTVENRVPAYMNLKLSPVDVDGNVMGEDELSVEVSTTVLASADGENSAETPLVVRLKQNKRGALSKLDGLAFHIEGAASADGQNPVVGKTLNSQRHFLIARDIVVKLVGKVIGDFN